MTHPADTATKALEQQRGYLSDNVYRYRMQQKADPDFVTGNDEPIADVIARHDPKLKEIQDAIDWVEDCKNLVSAT